MSDEALIGTGPLAEALGVKPETLVKWVSRHPPGSRTPCPQPVRINTGRRFVYGWREHQVAEWRTWQKRKEGAVEQLWEVAQAEKTGKYVLIKNGKHYTENGQVVTWCSDAAAQVTADDLNKQ